MAVRFAAIVASIFLGALSGASEAAINESPRVAFFGFTLINTSLEPTSAVEATRLRMLDDLLREKLDASGRFRMIAISPEFQKKIATGPEIRNCNGCERDFAKSIAADQAAWGTLQKVSNLILIINLYMVDVETGNVKFARSVDIRGNTDESWRRGLDYLLRHYLFGEP
jgi:hypothetical protein